jgi:hypothetical protein
MKEVAAHDSMLRLAMTMQVGCTPFEACGDTDEAARRIMAPTGGTFEVLKQTAEIFSVATVRGVFPDLLPGHPK